MSKRTAGITLCVVALMSGCKWLDVQTRNIAGYEQYMGVYAAAPMEIEKAPTVTGTIPNNTSSNNSITFTADLASRGNIERETVSDENRIKNINSILKGKLKNKGAVFLSANDGDIITTWRQVAIAAHETGYGTQGYILTHNNVGGMMGNNGKIMAFKTIDESIKYHAKLLRKYAENGRETLTDIQPLYCPVGAKNDPSGINKHWLPNTLRIYKTLEEMG